MDVPDGDNLASCPYFKTDRKTLLEGEAIANAEPERFSILSVIEGTLESAGGRRFPKGSFLLLPRGASALTALKDSAVLQVTLPG